MRQTVGFEAQTIGVVTAAAQIAFLVAAFVCSHLCKRFGEGRVIIAAVLVAGIILSMISAVDSSTSMVVLVGTLGATAAFMVISRTVDFQYRSRVNGLVSGGTAYGQFAAGSIAPWLVLDTSWRTVWLVLGIASVLVAIVGFLALKAFAPASFSMEYDARSDEKQPSQTGASIFTRTNFVVWTLLAASGMACGP